MPVLLVPFLGVVAVLTVTPGPDMLLVLRNGLRGGSRTAWFTGLGCCAGISVHATAAVLGLSAVLAASATAYSVVKLAGAAYLAYLGVRMLLSALRPTSQDTEPRRPGRPGAARDDIPETRTNPARDTAVNAVPQPAPCTAVKAVPELGADPAAHIVRDAVPEPTPHTAVNAVPGPGADPAAHTVRDAVPEPAPHTAVNAIPGPGADSAPHTVEDAPGFEAEPAPHIVMDTASEAAPGERRGPGSVAPLGRAAAFRQGLFTNLLNPKIALLFLTLLPQFVGQGEPRLRTTAVLAAVFLALAVIWWRLFTLALNPVSRLLRTPRVRRTLDGVAGGAMLAISVRVALEPR